MIRKSSRQVGAARAQSLKNMYFNAKYLTPTVVYFEFIYNSIESIVCTQG
jgi:hypothetical protein